MRTFPEAMGRELPPAAQLACVKMGKLRAGACMSMSAVLKGTSKNSKTRSVIANEVKQSRVFERNQGRLPRRFAPRNDISAIFRGPLKTG